MKTVTISECKAGGKSWTHTARTDDDQTAIARTIKRHFGRKAWFWRDNGLKNQGMYGQIAEPIPGHNASNCVTGRVSISVS